MYATPFKNPAQNQNIFRFWQNMVREKNCLIPPGVEFQKWGAPARKFSLMSEAGTNTQMLTLM